MNLTNLAAALRDDITTIHVKFINDCGELSTKEYAYKCKRNISDTLEAGDPVMVMAAGRNNYKNIAMAIVVTVDDEPDIDLDSNTLLKWVICKVDIEEVAKLQREDDAIGKKLRVEQARNCRTRALAALGIDEKQAKLFFDKPHPTEDPTFDIGDK